MKETIAAGFYCLGREWLKDTVSSWQLFLSLLMRNYFLISFDISQRSFLSPFTVTFN
jgi:hypothetical protein